MIRIFSQSERVHIVLVKAIAMTGACWMASVAFAPARGAGILGTKHDLSAIGPGPVKAVSESGVCLFCHTPHNGTGQTPLWNHTLSSATYTPYDSSTTKATIGQPTGATKLCLSCHDGTVAVGMVHNRATAIQMANNVTTMPAGASQLGTDLSDDHPVSFVYDGALASADGQLHDPSTLTHKVRLDHDHQLQCTACHDPHNDTYGKFLVQDNYASALCLNCHNITPWQTSVHRTSSQTWNGLGVNPWPHTGETTVAANGCENCHTPHNAGTRQRLLTFSDEEQNCFSCHNGNVATKDIRTEFNKPSTHPILATSGVHDPTEDPINSPRHVECADCHNSHAANSGPATAPNASGALAGTTGVNSSGAVVNPIRFQYEQCFRCHADSVNRGSAYVTRQIVQTNKRLQFSPTSMSYHPLLTAGKNANSPSLMSPWNTSSILYCTDCHNNDQGPNANRSGPAGPHGSIYPPLLERNLTTVDFQPENYATYELCYKCHDRNQFIQTTVLGFAPHKRHVVDDQTACTTCHDSHGVQTMTHLINFNTTYVSSFNGQINYTDLGGGHGTCTLTCHGVAHDGSPRYSY